MQPKNDRTESRPALPPAPRKRFRIQKLEERLAPQCRYNPQSKLVGCGGGRYDSSALTGYCY